MASKCPYHYTKQLPEVPGTFPLANLDHTRNDAERQLHTQLQAVEARNYEKLEMIERMARTR